MTATRSRKEEKEYKEFRKTAPKDCPFCNVSTDDEDFIEETEYFVVIKNKFPYSLWDYQGVSSHLMVVPKEHTDNLSKLPGEAAVEFVKIISKYEEKSYNIYARAPSSVIKSVVHQHTHLIKPTGRPKRFVFLLRKPFVRFVR